MAKGEIRQITLTGERVIELGICRAMLIAAGVPETEINNTRILSASMQTLMAHLRAGMKIAWAFDDARHRNGQETAWADANRN